METTLMKMEYLKQTDNGNVLWRSFFNVDELIWNGKYTIKISDDDGTSQLPFSLGNDETVSLFVQDNGQEGTNEYGRTIVQTITRVKCSCGKVSTYTRTRYNDGGAHVWSQWTAASEIPVATNTALGGVIIGDGLSVNADGKVSVDLISEEKFANELNAKINTATTIVPKIINPPTVANIKPEMKSWVNNDTSGHVSDNLVQVYDEVYQMNRKCVELTSTDRARFISPFNIGVDFTTNVLRGSFCIQKDYPVEHIGVFDIELYSNNLINADNRATFQIYYGNMSDADYNARYVRGGWFHFCVNPDALIIATKRGANFDITNVTHVGIHPYHTTGIPLKVYVGDFSVVKNLLKPGVVTIVDNFDASVPAMADYAYSKGVKLNLSIVPNWIEKGSGSATLEEINRIKRQGHFIFSHTFDHITDTSDMTELQIVEEITKGAEWMQNNGFNRGKFVVSNPSAMFPLAKYEAYMESPLQMLYHHWVSCPSGVSNGILLYYPYYPMSRLLNISSLDKCDDAILIAGKAKEKGGIAVNGYHGTFWNADGGTQWKKYIDAIAELDVKHYGIDEIIEGSVV